MAVIQLSIPIPSSFLIICPQCFDCWARLEGLDQSFWWHRYIPCTDHPQSAFPYGCWIAGSLLELDQNTTLFDVLPEDLIRREFELIILKETQDESQCLR